MAHPQAETLLSRGKPVIFLSTTLWLISFMSHSMVVFKKLLKISSLRGIADFPLQHFL
jgi:hypothetical protein